MSKGENMAARAINAAPFAYLAGSGHGPGECVNCDEEREQARQIARAVIEALMEPPPELEKAAEAYADEVDQGEKWGALVEAFVAGSEWQRTALSQPNEEGEGK